MFTTLLSSVVFRHRAAGSVVIFQYVQMVPIGEPDFAGIYLPGQDPVVATNAKVLDPSPSRVLA
jgi:hypothetical protein